MGVWNGGFSRSQLPEMSEGVATSLLFLRIREQTEGAYLQPARGAGGELMP